MVVIAESTPGYRVRYPLEGGQAIYGGDGVVLPAMPLANAEKLRQSLSLSSGLSPNTFELIPLGDVPNVESEEPESSNI